MRVLRRPWQATQLFTGNIGVTLGNALALAACSNPDPSAPTGPAVPMPQIQASIDNSTPDAAQRGMSNKTWLWPQGSGPAQIHYSTADGRDFAWLVGQRNDLEAAAIAVSPVVGSVLETLAGEPEALLARVSGSGGTCFALCASDIEAESLAERIEGMAPGWWVRRCRLGGPWPDPA